MCPGHLTIFAVFHWTFSTSPLTSGAHSRSQHSSPVPSKHSIFLSNAAQSRIPVVCSQGALLGCFLIPSGIHCSTHILISRATSHPATSQPLPTQGLILPQVQNVIPFLTDLHELHVGLLPRFIPLDLGSPTSSQLLPLN